MEEYTSVYRLFFWVGLGVPPYRALLFVIIGLTLGQLAPAETLGLDEIFQNEVLSEESLEELERLNRDDPKFLYKELNRVWQNHRDAANKKIVANVAWALLINLYEQGITDGQDEIFEKLFSPEFAEAIAPIRHDLEFRKLNNDLAQGKTQFSAMKDRLLATALQTTNSKRRLSNISAVVFDILDHGLNPNELAIHINELRQHLVLDASKITSQDLNFINYMVLILEKIGQIKESQKLQAVLENYCNFRQARSFCSLFFYNKGYMELKQMEPGYAQRALPYMERALRMAQAVNDKDNIASAHYGLEWAYNSARDYPNAIRNGLLAAEEYKELKKPDWIATVLTSLSIAYFHIKDFGNALKTAEEALAVCPPEYKVEVMSIYRHLSKVHESVKNYQESNKYLHLFLELRAETQNEDVKKKYLELRNEALDKQNDLQSQQILLLSRFRVVSGLACILFLLACVAVLFILRAKKELSIQSLIIVKQKLALQEVMNNIKIGIIKLDFSLKMQAETSAWAYQFFGLSDHEDIKSILNKLDASEDEKQSTIEALKVAMGSDELQWELNAGVLLSKAYFGKRRIHIDYSPVFKSGLLDEVICNIEDVTERYETEQAIKAADEKAERVIFKARKIIAKGQTAQSFLRDVDRLCAGLETCTNASAEELSEVLRNIHSIKGNARTAGLSDIASMAHNFETAIGKNDRASAKIQASSLIDEIREYQNALGLFFGSDSFASESVLEIVAGLRPDIESRLRENDLALDSIAVIDELGLTSPFVKEIILHGLTNAIDHGFVLPKKQGQAEISPAKLEIEASRYNDSHRLVIRDNGAGIDWKKLSEIAEKKAFVPAMGRPISDVVFLEGVSTATAVSLSSGRGQGMGAIKSAANQLKGDVLLLDNDRTQGSMLVVAWGAPIS